jgi:hypothetical protein
MHPSEAEYFQNSNYRLYATHLGIDIWFNNDTYKYELDVYDSRIGQNRTLISGLYFSLIDTLNSILAYNFYESLNVISDSLEEKKKDFNNPVSNYENVVNAFLKKVNDSFL